MNNNSWFNHQKSRLQENFAVEGPLGCHVWKRGGCGRPNKKYGTIRVKFPGMDHSKNIYVHRLSYMCSRRTLDLPAGLHVSHLCHNTLCIKPEHLSLEPHYVNNGRKDCTGRNPPECSGHGIYPKCTCFFIIFFSCNTHRTKIFTPFQNIYTFYTP